MPNRCHPVITHDGPRNAVIEVTGETDNADLALETVVDVSQLYAEPGYSITRLRIDTVEYMISPGLFVELMWQGSKEHTHIMEMSGKGFSNQERMGGRQNIHADATGNILLRTQGGKSGRKTFSFALEVVKQFT